MASSYRFSVVAVNTAGSSLPVTTSVVTPLAVPQSPTGLAAGLGNGAVTVSWVAPVDDGGSALTGFTVTAAPGGASCTAAAGDTSCVVTGLTKGSTYTFEVVAQNSVGASLPATINATVPTRPDAPVITSIVPGEGSLAVTWTPSASDGGAPITLYRVTAARSGATFTCEGLPTDTTCTITGLQPPDYTVYVQAINVAGISTIANFEYAAPSAPAVETFGLLRVTTSPALPSRIFVDGIARSDWGLDWLTVATGQHTVCFSDVVGFETPPCEVITVTEGAATVVQGDFVKSGLLKVEVSPAGLPTTIFVDGEWRDEYGLFTFIAPGDHEICWGDVAGFQAPDCEVVSIASGENVTVSGEFVSSASPTPGPAPVPDLYGYLRVTTSPAVPARVVVDGLERADWALTWVKVPVGDHVVCFSDVIGFETPGCETVVVVADQTTAVVGNYAPLGLLKVGVEPAGLAVDVVVDGVGRNQFGAYFYIEPGTYEVCGTDAPGFVTPACESVTVVGGAQSDTTLSYAPA